MAPPQQHHRRRGGAHAVAIFGVVVAFLATAACAGGDDGAVAASDAAGVGDRSAATVADEAPAVAVTAGPEPDRAGSTPRSAAPGPDDGAAPITALDDPRVTDAQRAAAQQLIDVTSQAMAGLGSPEAATAAGYVSIGDGGTGFEHFVNPLYLIDRRVLDPAAIESVVFRVHPDGTREPASAMYILEAGSTMADVPDVAGKLTTWHDHQDLCWEGLRVVGHLVDGRCQRGQFRPTPPMLHVWVVEHPCGPFAGIEGHGGGCGDHHATPPEGHGSGHHHGDHTD